MGRWTEICWTLQGGVTARVGENERSSLIQLFSVMDLLVYYAVVDQ